MGRDIRIRLIVLVVIFSLLTVFSVHWTQSVLKLGQDFQIYFNAMQNALHGRSAYFPYSEDNSFFYHPSVLSILSVLATLPLGTAYAIWSLLSLAAYSFSIYLIFIHLAGEGMRWRRIAPYIVVLVFFAPFIETLYLGQIDAFVTLLLILCLWFDEHHESIPAGICLGVAILLKTSPVIVLLYFLAMRHFRVLIATSITLAVFSLFTFVQFGPQVYTDFLSVLGLIEGDRVFLGVYTNLSAVAITFRVLTALQMPVSSEVITWAYRLILGGSLALLAFQAWRGSYATTKARYQFFGAILIVMTMFSPIVWFHHNVFLLLPLGLTLLYRTRSGLAILFLMQTERLFYNFVSVSIGHHISMESLPLALAFTGGTLTFIGQCWLLYVTIQGVSQEHLSERKVSEQPVAKAAR
ncbi:MAG: glycosyltransferase family 87 protein [Aggregatilineales bacterium]